MQDGYNLIVLWQPTFPWIDGSKSVLLGIALKTKLQPWWNNQAWSVFVLILCFPI